MVLFLTKWNDIPSVIAVSFLARGGAAYAGHIGMKSVVDATFDKQSPYGDVPNTLWGLVVGE